MFMLGCFLCASWFLFIFLKESKVIELGGKGGGEDLGGIGGGKNTIKIHRINKFFK